MLLFRLVRTYNVHGVWKKEDLHIGSKALMEEEEEEEEGQDCSWGIVSTVLEEEGREDRCKNMIYVDETEPQGGKSEVTYLLGHGYAMRTKAII